MVHNLYYRHSGQFSLGSVALGTLAATAIGSALAAAYAALVLYIPLAGVITFILSIGFGVLLGLVTAGALRWAKVRHEGIAFLSSATVALSSFYVSWAVWTWLLLRQSKVEAHLSALAAQPEILWGVVGDINAMGAWSMSGATPTGAVLWVLWGVEALLILVPAVLVPLGVLAVPFCDRCDAWCDASEGVARLTVSEADELKSLMEAKRIDALERLGAAGERDTDWIRVDLHDCPSCDNLHTLTLKSVSVSVADDGDRQQKEVALVDHLLLTTEESHRIRALSPEPAKA